MQGRPKWLGVMNEILLKTIVDADHAAKVLQVKAPDLKVMSATLRRHPFAGFEFHVPALAGRGGTARALVDYYSGKAFISDRWESDPVLKIDDVEAVSDPSWNSISFETARQRAKALLSTAALRKARLAWKGGVKETASVEKVWKPNWILDVRIQGRNYRVIVDGLNGGYFFIES